jgi:N-acetylmuramoyl-L-alanine amidase
MSFYHYVFNPRTLLLTSFALIFFSVSCSRLVVKDTAYTKLVEPFNNLDTSPLLNRVIVLDAGHGGAALGAVGSKGLEEKTVNLNVALQLKNYLEDAGAQVIMTREYDHDLMLTQIDSLRGNDLDYRVRTSNDADADLFISLHHNSRLPVDRQFNAIETYYKMEDYYSSKDAAKFIHKHLVINLQIQENSLRPGNYYVLRNNSRTAVLGEASYISNPSLEKKLGSHASIEIEAKSYFLGILDYFSRGIPKIVSVLPGPYEIISEALPAISVKVEEDLYGDGVDPQMIRVGIDGKRIPFIFDSPLIKALPEQPLSNGLHTLNVSVVNMKGNHSLLFESKFTVDEPPAHLIVNHTPKNNSPRDPVRIMIRVNVLDRFNNGVKNGTLVGLRFQDETGTTKKAHTKNGAAFFYIAPSEITHVNYSVFSGEISTGKTISRDVSPQGILWLSTLSGNTYSTTTLSDVRIELNNTIKGFTNHDGVIVLDYMDPGNHLLNVRKNGYYPEQRSIVIEGNNPHSSEINLDPMYGGALLGKKIVVDPEFGGLVPGAVGPTGLLASDENMETARYLVHYLETAGAEVELTINPGEDLSLYSRVRFANTENAELFISLRRTSGTIETVPRVTLFAYPTSTQGKKLGSLILDSFRAMSDMRTFGPVEAADYVLQQTGSPAVIVDLNNISDPLIEEELYGTQRNRQEAYAVFAGILQYYMPSTAAMAEISGRITDQDGNPVGNAVVNLDKTIYIQTDSQGLFKFTVVEPRNYKLSIEAKGYQNFKESVTIQPKQLYSKEFVIFR